MVRKKAPRSIRVGVIGCGEFGNFHIDQLLKMEGVEITALYNRGIEKLEKAGKKLPKARMYQDVQKMLGKEKLDAVIISLAPDAHGETEELCCKKGIHMFIEKPIALHMTVAEKISEGVKFSGVITSVGYQERYSPPLELVKELLEKEPVGLVTASWIGGMKETKWRRWKEESGGQIVEQSTHIVDMLRYLFGEVSSVYASGKRDPRFEGGEHDVEDYSTAVLSFQNGVVAALQTGCYSKNDGVGKMGFELFTPRCKISYAWGQSLTVTSGERTEEVKVIGDNHIPALEAFVEAVKTGDRIGIRSPYEDAVKSLKVTLMANESMKTGAAVSIQ